MKQIEIAIVGPLQTFSIKNTMCVHAYYDIYINM